MARIRLIHWNAAEAAVRLDALRSAGYDVEYESPFGPTVLRALREDPPAAVVIDLSRSPSRGRDVAVFLRLSPATRRVPIVFAEGDAEQVARIRTILPDAGYTAWDAIQGVLRDAIARPVNAPVVPGSALAGYSGTPLPRKLGVKENSSIALVDAPPGLERLLRSSPKGTKIVRGARARTDLTLWFPRSQSDLRRRIRGMASRAERGGLWIAWPKKSSAVASDLDERVVREVGLAAGLVDFKVSAIDATWSGLRFTRRKTAMGSAGPH